MLSHKGHFVLFSQGGGDGGEAERERGQYGGCLASVVP